MISLSGGQIQVQIAEYIQFQRKRKKMKKKEEKLNLDHVKCGKRHMSKFLNFDIFNTILFFQFV